MAPEGLYTLPGARLCPDQHSDPTGQVSTRPDGEDHMVSMQIIFDPTLVAGPI